MAKILKIVAATAGILIILILLAGLILPRIIDVNKHKDRISLAIQDSTGYTVIMEGDIELSLIPWIGLRLEKTHVANPPGFEDRYMASLEELQVRVRFWPLLTGSVKADTVILKGFNLALVKDEQGRPNWVGPDVQNGRDVSDPAPEPAVDVNEGRDPFQAIAGLNIEGLEISRAAISYEDRQENQLVYIREFNLKTGKIAANEPIRISGDFELENMDPDLIGDFNYSTLAVLDSRNEAFRLDNLELIFNADGDLFAAPIKNGSLKADMIHELSAGVLNISSLEISFHDALIQGVLQARNLDQTPDLVFELNGKDINLDKILARPADNSSRPSEQKDPEGDSQHESNQDQPINLSFLHDFNLEGQISIEHLTVNSILINSISAAIESGRGKMSISPFTARLYDGVQEADIALEDRNKTLHISMNQDLSGFQVGPFIMDLTEKDILTGTGMIQSNLRAQGMTGNDFIENLSGKARIELSNGVIKGADLEKMIRNIFALAAGQIGSAADDEQGETGFTVMKAGFDINKGIAVSRDVELKSPIMSIHGELTADLPRSRLDSRSFIQIDGTLKEELVARYDFREVTIPLIVKGPFDDLSFALDSEAFIKSFVRRAGDEVMRKLLDRAGVPGKDESEKEKPPSDVEGLLKRIIPGR